VPPSPYRQPDTTGSNEIDLRAEEAPQDFDLLPVYAVLWTASVARLVGPIARRDMLGALDVLAGLAVVGLPILVRRPLRALVARARRGIKKS
jgi:hypothetical protein